MLRMLKFAVPVIALAALALFTTRTTLADDVATSKPSSVKVTVVDGDKKPVEGAHVRLTVPQKKNGEKNLAAGDKHPAIAEGDTAADGTVQFDGIAPGDYSVQAAKKDLNLKGRASVTVLGDGALVAVTVKLRPGKAPAAGN